LYFFCHAGLPNFIFRPLLRRLLEERRVDRDARFARFAFRRRRDPVPRDENAWPKRAFVAGVI
jgi:hypothetical protein